MKERHSWGALGFILMAFSLATFLICPESPITIGVLTLPVALNMLLYSGVAMLSVGCVSLIVDRL